MSAAIREKFSKSFPTLSLNLFQNTLDEQKEFVTPHWHERLEIIHIIKGEGIITIDFQDYPVCENDIAIIPPSALHSAKGRNNHSMTSQTVVFTLECLPSNREYEPVLREGMPGYQEIITLMNLIFQSKKIAAPQKELLLQGYVTALYGLIVCHQYERQAIHRPLQDSQPIKDVITYIQAHYSEKISLDTLAQIAGYSKCYFTRYFSKHVGFSCTHYIQTFRLEKAKKFLQTTDWNISMISEKTGFESVSYFIKVFKQQEKISPLQYRTKHTSLK